MNRHGSLGIAVAVMAAGVIALTTACVSNDLPASPPDEPTVSAPDEGCKENWPDRIQPKAETNEEIEFLEDISVCASEDQTSLLIVNNSDVVWYFAAAGDGDYTVYPQDEVSERFRESQENDHVYMAPEDQVIAQFATSTDAASAAWYIDRPLSTVLALQTIFEDQVESLEQDTGVALFGKGSPARRAVATCAVAGYNSGMLIGKEEVAFNADTLATVAGDVGCAGAWRQAEDVLGVGKFPSATSAITGAAEVGERAALWVKIGEYARLGCQILPGKC